MTIAVTGATGFIGSRLLEIAAVAGQDVRALTRRAMKPMRGVSWVDGALDRPNALAELVQGAASVIHIAGAINGRTAADFDTANVDGTRAMVDAAKAAGVRRFVHVSSLAAREPSLSLYGSSKAKSEAVIGESGLHYAIVRPPTVYGPGDRETLELFRWAKRGLMFLPPEGKASIIHADDLSRLLLALAEGSAPSAVLFEPEDGSGGLTHRQLAAAIGEAVGRRVLAVSMPPAALRAGAIIDQLARRGSAKLTRDRAAYFCHFDWVADPARSVPSDVWSPSVPLHEGLASTAAWYRHHGWL